MNRPLLDRDTAVVLAIGAVVVALIVQEQYGVAALVGVMFLVGC